MDKQNSSLARKVGLFGLVGLAIIALLLVNFSRGAGFWKKQYEVTVRAEGVGGLKTGAFVAMSGVPIGTVKRISLAPDMRHVLIDCLIESHYDIHSDARFEIETSGFLGDQYISITPQSNLGGVIRPGGTIEAVKPFNMTEAVRSAVNLMQRLEGAAAKLDGAVSRVDRGLFSDTVISDLTNTIANARRVTERAGLAVRGVEDLIQTNTPTIQESLNNVQAFSARLNQFGNQLDGLTSQMGGVVSNLDSVITSNRADLHIIVANAREATTDLKSITSDLQSGKGVAGALLKDPSMKESLHDIVGNLGVLSSNLSRHGILWKPRENRSLTNQSRYSGRTPFQ